MRLRLRRTVATSLLVAFVAAPVAQATIVFKGFSAKREAALRSDLGKSLFPFSSLLTVTVKPGDLPEGTLGLASDDHTVILDGDAFKDDALRTFAFMHELSHEVDFQILEDSERGRFYEAAGFGKASAIKSYKDTDWFDSTLEHDRIPAEQFASAIPLVVWPVSAGNSFVAEDGTCIGWEKGEGCAAPLTVVRELVNAALSQEGFPPLASSGPSNELLEETFVPPKVAAPAERPLRTPDGGPAPVATSLAAIAPLTGVTSKEESLLRARLSGPLGALPSATVILDYQDADGWWQVAELRTNRAGEATYRFRPKGWRPTAFRLTFAGSANVAGASLVVPISYT